MYFVMPLPDMEYTDTIIALAVALFTVNPIVTHRFSNPITSETSIKPVDSDTKPAVMM